MLEIVSNILGHNSGAALFFGSLIPCSTTAETVVTQLFQKWPSQLARNTFLFRKTFKSPVGSIISRRSPPVEFAELVLKRSPSRKEAHPKALKRNFEILRYHHINSACPNLRTKRNVIENCRDCFSVLLFSQYTLRYFVGRTFTLFQKLKKVNALRKNQSARWW